MNKEVTGGAAGPAAPPASKKRTARRPKHIPQRTCIGCRQVRGKREMVRVVRTQDGRVDIDPTGKRAGRGAYICNRRSCWEAALSRGRLDHALETQMSEANRQALLESAQGLPEEPATPEQDRGG